MEHKIVRALTHPVPVYVTREDCDGLIGTVGLSAWMVLLLALTAWINAVAWGVFGLVELWRVW